MPYATRILPPDEWGRLASLESLGIPPDRLPPPDSLVIVVEREGDQAIVGRWMAYNIVVLEGLAIDPAYQHFPRVAGGLLNRMMDELRTREIPAVLTLIQTPEVERLAEHAGFVQVPGTVWQKDLQDLRQASLEKKEA